MEGNSITIVANEPDVSQADLANGRTKIERQRAPKQDHAQSGDENAKRKRARVQEDVLDNRGDDLTSVVEFDDQGATAKPDKTEDLDQHGRVLEKGVYESTQFPLLDVEPNTVTSRNVEDVNPTMVKRTEKPRIDFHKLAYEASVSRIQGHKKAYNSSSYGTLHPDYEHKTSRKAFNKQVYRLDSESLMESLSEAPFGLKTVNQKLADDMKREQRTYVLTTSADHGGPSMYRRGLNQFKNKALKKYVTDPDSNSVEVQKQVARDGMRLNNLDLFPSERTRVNFKSRYNQARGAERDGTGYATAAGSADYASGGSLSESQRILSHGFGTTTQTVPQTSLVGQVVNPGVQAPFVAE